MYRLNSDELPFVRVCSFFMLLVSVAYGAAICKTRSYLSDLSMDPLIGLCFFDVCICVHVQEYCMQ